MFPKAFSQCTTGLANILTWERGVLFYAGGGGNAIYVPCGDVPPTRVYFWPSNPRQGVFFRA